MAHAHFGSLADVFKHMALAEILGALRPGEYWESHAGAAVNAETTSPTAERLHGIHTFLRVANENEALRCSLYYRAVMQVIAAGAMVAGESATKNFPGSPMLARLLMPETARRLLFCDTDADCLNSIRIPLRPVSMRAESRGRDGSAKEFAPEKIECVQDDGVTVLRGAGILLPEQWTPSTLVLIDPEDMDAATDSDISPLNLTCELAARGIVTVLWYGFKDDAERLRRHQSIKDGLLKSRLTSKAQRFEGTLKTPDVGTPPTQWGWGILTLNVPTDSLGRVNIKLKALEGAYEKTELAGWGEGYAGTGAWKLTHSTM